MYSSLSLGTGAVLVVSGMQELLLKRVSAACRMAKARFFNADAGNLPVLPAASSVVVVAELHPGERQIPEAAVDLVQSTRNAPIVLLCSEPLLRPSTVLQNGRVTLLGPPVATGRIYSQLHLLLNDSAQKRVGRETIPIPNIGGGPLEVVEKQQPLWWIGSAGCDPRGHEFAQQRVPLIEDRHGLAAVLPAPGRSAPAEFQTRDVLAAADGNVEALHAACSDQGVAGFIHLSRDAKQWSAFWSGDEAEFAIHSAMRVPPVWRRQGGPGLLRLPAASGDTAVVATRSLLPEQEFREAIADQGPCLLSAIRRSLTANPSSASVAIVEVR